MNPYEVLEIKEGASEAEIKAAYKRLVKKYHPDVHQNNPLSDLAEEKLRQVNEAYDMLMNGTYSGSSSSSSYSGSSYGSPQYAQIRRDIDHGNLQQAEATLYQTNDRSAEWFFLKGVIASRKGWYDEAVDNLQQAVNMAPGNVEYQRHLNSIAGQGNMFRNAANNRGYNTQSRDDIFCQALQCYCCADFCCECI